MKNKAPLVIIGLVMLLVIGGIIAYALGQNSQPTNHDGMDMGNMNNQSESTDKADTQPVATNTVTIENFAYGPAVITVKKGTKVTWTNNDSVQHNVIGDDLKELNGPLLKKGESYSYTFNEVGEFGYYCGPHPYMKGTVIVTE